MIVRNTTLNLSHGHNYGAGQYAGNGASRVTKGTQVPH